MARWWMILVVGSLVGCTGGNASDGDTDDGADDPGSLMGTYDEIVVIQDKKLDRPRDLAFNPLAPDQLWVVNQETEGCTILHDVGTPDQKAVKYDNDFGGPHFFAQPAGIAFGDNGTMATIHDTQEKTQGENGTPGDFMGPTLWTTNLDDFDAGHDSHADMLHNSPLGVGIAWEVDNVYWVFDGYHSSITRYDFNQPHELGGTDHSDAIISRYMEGEVKRVNNGTPSGLWFDHATDELLIVDTGNNRILALDTTSGTRGDNIGPNYDGGDQFRMDGAEFTVLVDGDEVGMQRPSGIDVAADGTIFISDAGAVQDGVPAIFTFSRDGELLDYLEIAHDINGIALSGDGLYFVDPVANAVLRLQ